MSITPKLHFFKSEQKPYRLLDKDGNWLYPEKKAPLSVAKVKAAFERMIFQRTLDEKMLQMQRQGRMLTFAPNLGEECLQVATALAMNSEDWLIPAFRSGLLMLERGFSLKNMLLYWNGNERGCEVGEKWNTLPINITIGTQMSHAAGIGWALRIDKKEAAAVSFIGDGGTAEGEFYESLNFAALRKAKWVAAINNNGFAISTRTDLESGINDLSAKAIAAGAHYLSVDGNDIFASYEAAKLALDFARSENGGPVVLEFVTYRKGPHTTSDDPSIYLKPEEKTVGEATDPFIRTEKWLRDKKAWTDEDYNRTREAALKEIDEAFKQMEAELIPPLADVFDYTYAELTPDLKRQKEDAIKRFGGK
ncbi:pyruvate dehydrogenase E1 component alpha subunit [Mycoplasmoides fastidiosum]|uniref:2-oxoisovalerate dehydrogenase subunit alpha n=1 Tax=Mycoplasmoides fastidiosum TaxID=92758 RepID=A0ABU0LYU8_9BACT|nr:thiamine pyrophosphate-dependent dehydrogenase E1 component subunit alpha [Mycoplasmoides fastidiosum]MDQ0513891.1 pyruvate dehydrogenase E1 component alpha subunit [Mycoplasmoides fastidiosum]UUD37695.1 thiamine pyrophosphate-dependent dehydrogenase E1 component subunit alpha [Mycoplasmoides fastidiosum]